MSTICAGRSGPAVGARGLIGSAQEGCWGSQVPTPRKYVDMLNESIVSEIGSLISASLRPDRAVHKRIGGTENAGGDVNVELGPTGYENWIKHALGKVESERLDMAFILKVVNAGATTATLAVTQVSGLAVTFAVTLAGGGSASFSADLTDASADTIGELMALINGSSDLAAYSPEEYYDGTNQTTLDVLDYTLASDPANSLAVASAVDLLTHPDKVWVITRGWGVYKHIVKAHSELPEGLSILVGRDVASFLYAGCKFNTFGITATPGEILTSVFGVMAKGGTTCSPPTADIGNTGNERNAFSIRYKGAGATCTMTIVHGDTFKITSATGPETIFLNIAEEYIDPDTGRVYAVNKLGGLLEYLKGVASSYLDVSIASYADWEMPSTYLKAAAGVDIKTLARTVYNFDSTDIMSAPVMWGDYIGADSGTPVTFYVKATIGGVPGTAKISFSTDGVTYLNEILTSATEPTKVRVGASATDTGFEILFPDDSALVQDDVWTFDSIYIQPSSVVYASDQDPFSGFEGALYMDNAKTDIMGWTTTLTNNLFGDKYHMGERVRGMLPEQKRNIEGSLTAEFDNLDLYRRFVNGVSAALEVRFISSVKIANSAMGDSKTEFGIVAKQPNIKFNGTTPVIPGEEIISVDVPYVAMWDDVNSLPDMTMEITNNVPFA